MAQQWELRPKVLQPYSQEVLPLKEALDKSFKPPASSASGTSWVHSECNLVMENCKDSFKATANGSKLRFKRVSIPKKQPEIVMKRLMKSDYLDILNKRILI